MSTNDSTETETKVKYARFNDEELGRVFPMVIAEATAPEGTVLRDMGYPETTRFYMVLSENSEERQADTDIYDLRRKLSGDVKGSTFWSFLQWVDAAAWSEIPAEWRLTDTEFIADYETGAKGALEEIDERLDSETNEDVKAGLEWARERMQSSRSEFKERMRGGRGRGGNDAGGSGGSSDTSGSSGSDSGTSDGSSDSSGDSTTSDGSTQ